MLKTVAEAFCPFCGQKAKFEIEAAAVLLREAGCTCCGASLRSADTAAVLLGLLGEMSGTMTLAAAAARHHEIDVLNLFSEGPIHAALRGLPGYHFGEYFDGVRSGERQGDVLCVDLQHIPFADASFDYLITEDVLEHVGDFRQAFREAARVLRPGGWHVFTVPVHEGHATASRTGKPPVYHGDPLREQGALVVTDFGSDLPELLRAAGMGEVRVVEGHRFYAPEEVSWFDRPEDLAVYEMHRQSLLQAFRYNSLVIAAQKPQGSALSRWYHRLLAVAR